MTEIPMPLGDENVKKTKTYLLATILLVSSVLVIGQFPGVAKASNGYAKVYILCLSGVGGGYTDPEKVKDGAIEACTYKMPYGAPRNMPVVHVIRGNYMPFYEISYTVVTDWSTYKNIFESSSYRECIVVNTHGEFIPIPSGYPNPADWVDTIAEAMLERRITWVHVAMYPFYYVWHEGASSASEWPGGGPNGFRTLMGHIGLPDVTCWSPDDSTYCDLAPGLDGIFEAWTSVPITAMQVQLSRPLWWGDFSDRIIMNIFHNGLSGEERYCAGAVVAFAATDTTFETSDMYGFGAYVHLGAGEIVYGSGDKHFDKGYVATAAAVFIEVNAFEGDGMTAGDLYQSSGEQNIFVTPVLTSHYGDPNYLHVYFVFTVFASLIYDKTPGVYLEHIDFYLSGLPSGTQAMMREDCSKTGEGWGEGLTGIYISDEMVFFGKALMSVIGVAVGAPWSTMLGAISLAHSWIDLISEGSEHGVGTFVSDYVQFQFTPPYTRTDLGDYNRDDYEAIIGIELRIPWDSYWRIASFDWEVSLYPDQPPSGVIPSAAGEVSFAYWSGVGNEAPIFYEDFENMTWDPYYGTWDGWNTWDSNGEEGADCWGILAYPEARGHDRMWCAGIGDNSIYGGQPNIDVKRYDKNMDSYLRRNFDLRPYGSRSLYFELENWVEAGDYFEVPACALTYTSNGFYNEGPITLGSGQFSAYTLEFNFYSDTDNTVKSGAYLNDVEIRGTITNDADTGQDAGNILADATTIATGGIHKSYAGYLDNDDWFQFDLGEEVYELDFLLHPQNPSMVEFVVELYDPDDDLRAGPSHSIADFRFSTGYHNPDPGMWKVRVRAKKGFGQYAFDICLNNPTIPFPGLHDVAVTSVISSSTQVRVEEPLDITVNVENQGDAPETFDVAIYYDDTQIGTQTDINLPPGFETNLIFTWDTTGVPPGTYTIKAVASQVPHETDTADNTCVDGIVEVYWIHDVAVTSVTASPTSVKVGETVTINVNVENEGNYEETFWVSAWYEHPVTGCHQIGNKQQVKNLAAGETRMLTFYWDTADKDPVTYNILASATWVPGETDYYDNLRYFDGTVTIENHDVAVTSVIPSPSRCLVGETITIFVDVENQGDYAESFDVTTSYDGTSIATQAVNNLAAGDSTTLIFTWNTEGVRAGDYTIEAEATEVLGETDPDDNSYSYSYVTLDDPGGHPGCPVLYVYDGEDYVIEGLLGIHDPDPNSTDMTASHTLTVEPEPVGNKYLLRLTEHPQTHSHIDQVRLFAVLENGTTIELPLVWAWHSECGMVLPQLLFSDDWKTDTLGADHNNGTSQSIDLKFKSLPPNLEAVGFIFEIEGINPHGKK